MSCHGHEYPWPSLATSPYHSSLLAGLQGYIPYPHIAAVCIFELVVLLLLGHMRGSIGVHHWWVRQSVLFQTIQFSMSTQFVKKHFYFKLFKQLYITIQFSVSTVSMSKTVQFQIIHFSISTQFKCKYSLFVNNISILSYSVNSSSSDSANSV